MTKYIDADAFKEKYLCFGWFDDMGEEEFDSFPAADVEPVRHGRWEYNPDAIDYNLGGWVCSICGVRNSNIGNTSNIQPLMFAGSKYCPHCGARMDLEETK